MPTPIQQMAAVSVSEGRILVIQPWDVSTISTIEKAIQASDLGVNPQDDGKVIRLIFPPLTEEKEKCLRKTSANSAKKLKLRCVPFAATAWKTEKLKKDNEITEDDLHDGEDEMQKITDKFVKKIDEMVDNKEKDIMAI